MHGKLFRIFLVLYKASGLHKISATNKNIFKIVTSVKTNLLQ